MHSYDSSSFFIRNDNSNRVALIWGDVEPDSVSQTPRNKAVWLQAAKFIKQGLLNGIVIECSYAAPRNNDELYGHVTPVHLIEELTTLSGFLPPDKQNLADLQFIITHVKTVPMSPDVETSKTIYTQLVDLATSKGYECSFIMAYPGLHMQL